MAATNFTPIQLYFSTTASAAPTAANLAQGELAININDGKLYYEDSTGAVQVIATKGTGTIGGSTTQIQYNNAGALAGNAAMVFNNSTNVTTLTTLNLTNVLGAIYGGTAQSTYTQGDFVYASAANTLSKLGIGTVNYILTSSGSVPQWSAPSSISVLTATNLDGGAAGSVPYQSGVATTTFLAIGAANRVMTSTGSAPQWVTALTGLTGVSSSSITDTGLTSGRVTFASTSGLLADSANLTFNGTTLTTAGLSNSGFSTLVKTLTLGDTSFNGTAVFAAATPAKLYMGTGTVTDVTSAISATNTTGAIASLAITPIAATNTGVTYTSASTLYIAGAPSAGTNITITNPYSLYVAGGAIYLGGNTAVTGTLSATGTLSGGTSGTGYSFSGSAPATSLTLNSTGNLGVGTASPSYPLEIIKDASSVSAATIFINPTTGTNASVLGFNNSGSGGLNVGRSNSVGAGSGITLTAYDSFVATTGTTGIAFNTNNTTAMYISSGQNVGIGTSSPTSMLDVRGTNPIIRVEPNVSTDAASFQAINDSKISYFGRENSAGNYFFASTVTAYSTVVSAYNSTAPIIFGHSQPEVYIANGGNLGIGTSSPGAKLDVAGSAYIRGDSTNATFTSAGQLAIKRSSGDPVLSFHGNTGTQIGNIQFQDAGTCTIGVNVNQALAFNTNSTEHARISAAGDFTVSIGNVVIGTAGKGIDFSATSHPAGMTSELLADYEEGTWTPAPNFSTSNTYTGGTVYGSYTKVGRLVSATFLLSFEKNTATGNFTITGLPFTSLNSTGIRCALAISYIQRIGQADKIVTGYVTENTTTIQLYFTGQTSASTVVNITNSDIDAAAANVVGTVTYEAA